MKLRPAVLIIIAALVLFAALYFVADSSREKGPIAVKYAFAPDTRIPSIVTASIRTVRTSKRADSNAQVQVETSYEEKMNYFAWRCDASESGARVIRERRTVSMNLVSMQAGGIDITKDSKTKFDTNLPAPGFDFHNFNSRGVDSYKKKLGEGIYDLVQAAYDVRILPDNAAACGDKYSWSHSYGKIACDLKGKFIGSAFLGDSEILRFQNTLEIYRPLENGKRDVIGTVTALLKITKDGKPVSVDGSFRFWTLDEKGDDFIYNEDFQEIFGAVEKSRPKLAVQFDPLSGAYGLLRLGEKTAGERALKVFLVQFPESPFAPSVRELVEKKLEFQP